MFDHIVIMLRKSTLCLEGWIEQVLQCYNQSRWCQQQNNKRKEREGERGRERERERGLLRKVFRRSTVYSNNSCETEQFDRKMLINKMSLQKIIVVKMIIHSQNYLLSFKKSL